MAHNTRNPQISIISISSDSLAAVHKRLQKTTLLSVSLLIAILALFTSSAFTSDFPLWIAPLYVSVVGAITYWTYRQQSRFKAQIQELNAPITSSQAEKISAMLEPLTVVAPGIYSQCVSDIQAIASKKREITYAEFLTITHICQQVLELHNSSTQDLPPTNPLPHL